LQRYLCASPQVLRISSHHDKDFLRDIDRMFQSYERREKEYNNESLSNETRPNFEPESLYYPLSEQDYIQSLIRNVDESHLHDIQFCSLFQHENHSPDPITAKYSAVFENKLLYQQPSLSFVKTTKEPMFRSAAQAFWNQSKNNSIQSSRFTYQRKGNYEVHLVDLVSQNPFIQDIMNEALQNRIYPLVRKEYSPRIADLNTHQLCVYDALVIRYNATEASLGSVGIGAGQPLHRDLGLVSVNIMLNPTTDFVGGGTFFENQLLDGAIPEPLKPVDVGHALLHLSSDRHAGAATTQGIREILVIFLTAKKDKVDDRIPPAAPDMERSARLKSSSRSFCQSCSSEKKSMLCRVLHYRLAVQYHAIDGEAWHYLGMSLREWYKAQLNDNELDSDIGLILEMSLSCLRHAMILLPCDARLCNSLALVLESLWEYHEVHPTSVSRNHQDVLHEEITNTYNRSLLLHNLSERAGCDVTMDYDSACLNYGLYLSKRDMFVPAREILGKRFGPIHDLIGMNQYSGDHHNIRKHGRLLFEFCSKQ
jgi:hypothetical protein